MLYYMDFPYMFQSETTFKSKKGSRNNLKLVFENSIASPSSKKAPNDQVTINGYKVSSITKSGEDFTFDIKGTLSTDKVLVEVDKKRRVENMKNYLAYIILSMLFKKIYAVETSIISFQEDSFTFLIPDSGINNPSRDLTDIECSLNHIISSSLEVNLSSNNGLYSAEIPSLGSENIFYPVPRNTGEIKLALLKNVRELESGLEVTFETGDAAYKELLKKNREVAEIKRLLNYQGENIVDEVNFRVRSLVDLRDELYDLKENVYRFYLDLIKDDTYEAGSYKILSHNIKEIFIKDLKLMLDSSDADFKFMTNPKDENSEFIIKNSIQEIDEMDLIKELESVYPFSYEVKKNYIFGEIKEDYTERLKELIDRYLMGKLKKDPIKLK